MNSLDGNHPLIAGALGAFLRLVFVRPASALEAICNLTVGSIVAWYGAPMLLQFLPAAFHAEPRAAGLSGLALGFLSMWLLSWLASIVQHRGGNPFAVWKDIRKEVDDQEPPEQLPPEK